MKQSLLDTASILDTAAYEASPVAQISLQEAISLEDAYEIQAKSIDRRLHRGEEITGMKLGFTSKAKMEQMGVHDLIWGRLTNKMEIVNAGEMNIGDYIHPRAEPEIAFKLGTDINDTPTTIDEAVNCLSGIAVAIEIIDSRYENFKFSLEDVIADNCSSASYVLGDWKNPQSKVTDITMEMSSNGTVVEQGNSNAILGNPLESLTEALRLANQYGLELKKDMIILAGAATPAVFLKQGDQLEVSAGHLGSVSLNII